jgi:hypothetical protein
VARDVNQSNEQQEPIAMLNCRDATRLISQSMDTKLPWHRRLAMKIHLLYCVWCRRYSAQLQFLRKASQELPPEALQSSVQHLSNEEKERMRSRLRRGLNEAPPS